MDKYSAIVIAAGAFLLQKNQNDTKKTARKWISHLIQKREQYGAFNVILKSIDQQPDLLMNFIRMSQDNFNELVDLVYPFIVKQDTNFRKSISPAERLMITLRFISTGDTYKSLEYLFKIADSTIQKIIPETCTVLYNVLQKHLKVISCIFI